MPKILISVACASTSVTCKWLATFCQDMYQTRERERESCLQDQHTHMHMVIAGLERKRRETSAVAHASGELLPDHFRFWSTA